MDLTTDLVIQFIVYGVSIGIIYGTIRQQITSLCEEIKRLRQDYKDEIQMLRKEVEKHNMLVERTYKLEAEVGALKMHGTNN